jgi:hypothetical protein
VIASASSIRDISSTVSRPTRVLNRLLSIDRICRRAHVRTSASLPPRPRRDSDSRLLVMGNTTTLVPHRLQGVVRDNDRWTGLPQTVAEQDCGATAMPFEVCPLASTFSVRQHADKRACRGQPTNSLPIRSWSTDCGHQPFQLRPCSTCAPDLTQRPLGWNRAVESIKLC